VSALPAGTASTLEVVLGRVSSSTFVGRVDELAALDAALDRMPAFACVAGEPGVGKSRVVSEFESRAHVPVLVGHCLGATTLPYAPLVEALRPLGESVPDAASQAQVFEALLALLDRLGPVALVIEDLHWADPSTRDFLIFLIRNARTEPLFLLATYRSDELHRRHPLRPVLAELERAPRVERIALERFTRDEVTEQLTGILGDDPDPGLADRLYARAQGNALYTEELLAASADSGERPATPRDALLDRFERLPAPAQEVVRVAAVAERPIGRALLEAVTAGDVLEGTGEAVAHQLLVNHPDGTYAFRHALVGEAIYEDLLPGERTALHAALARAMEADPASSAAELACHWQGAHDLPRALGASVAAGVEARRLHAYSEALGHFEAALGLWDRVHDAVERAGMPRSAVLRAAAATANDRFEATRAVALQRKAIADAAGGDPVELARMYSELADYLQFTVGARD
jgi:predicted ATPase